MNGGWRSGSPSRWTTPAWEDLAEAADHIARDSRYYAAAFVLEARDAARSLNRFADRGREVPEYGDPAIRELFVQSYRLIYHVVPAEVRILVVIHQSRDSAAVIRRRPN